MRFSVCSPATAARMAALALAVLGAAPAAHAAGGLRASPVDETVSLRTFSASASLFSGYNGQGIGPGTGVWGVTSITITNPSVNVQQVNFVLGRNTGPDCSKLGVTSTGTLLPTVYVQPNSTQHLTFPTPLVIEPTNGPTCLAVFLLTGSTPVVQVQVNGLLN